MNQDWFEMPEIRRRNFSKSVWVPLRAIHTIEEQGKYGFLGYKQEFFGVGTLAVPLVNRNEAEKLGWDDIGISGQHSGYIQDNEYIPSTFYCHFNNNPIGEHLVLEQRINGIESTVWHLSQDLVLTLGLMREIDTWVRPVEGYCEVVRLRRQQNGSPSLIEIHSSHLRDYLCARNMALYTTSYRDRREILEEISHISWKENPFIEIKGMDRWEGRITEIHEGGMGFGQKTAVFHVERTDPGLSDDVPELDPVSDENTKSQSWTKQHHGRKLYFIHGELWRNEWLEPASASPLIRGDKAQLTVFFITNIEGKQENKEALIHSDSWLWFRPDVINALMSYRGAKLEWYTRDTGNVGCSPDDNVHFGINSISLINVYAKDIGMLPEWQQKIWAAHNISPDGGVSEELLDSQMRATPANTQAPERFLESGLNELNNVANIELGIVLLKPHDYLPKVLKSAHRFRAIDKAGFYALAKDIARLTADSIDSSAIQKIITLPKGEKFGSLKSLERLVTLNVDPQKARLLLAPLVGAYELRHGDSHLPSSQIDEALALAHVDKDAPIIQQGYQLLNACVGSIYEITKVLSDIGKKVVSGNGVKSAK